MTRASALITAVILIALSIFSACKEDNSAGQAAEPEPLVIRDSVVCYSLLGQPLKYLPETASGFAEKDSALKTARDKYFEDPSNLDNIVWYGRRLSYLTEYRQAMTVYTRGLHIHPNSPEIYRHRGHRYISMRRFEEAADDLGNAARLVRGRSLQPEPDGIPNPSNQPVSSLQFNIWYHLGLAYFLQAEYEDALKAYDSCMVYSVNTDLVIATTYWNYLTLMRLGDRSGAAQLLDGISRSMDPIENASYLELLLMFKGDVPVESVLDSGIDGRPTDLDLATKGYGVANYYFLQGEFDKGKDMIDRILEGTMWPAFGFIAAEADKARGLNTLQRPL